ncbi:FAD-dependent oxidoreductase [Culicoidibacter larvae]|uniref:FAD-binding protein n=1 Tax=Culicoidibacter larvae TaxID=2579976 RepID=A0A5R8QF89_9FIRM|nr:FAD-dependent oxidoreductase [Culicoidibacter larvae]TLG76675.1 FAD-binding protein [Culicoidibacter larvae]
MKRGLLMFALLFGAIGILSGCGSIDDQYDVVVIGGGASGMSAAIEADAGGAKVALIEADAILGGNSRFAFEGMNAAQSAIQSEAGVSDSVADYNADISSAADGMNNQNLSGQVAEDSAAALDWVNENGANFTSLIQLPGSSAARTHTTPTNDSAGLSLVSALESSMKNTDINVLRETQVLSITLVSVSNNLNRIEIRSANNTTKTITAKALILANQDLADMTNITNLTDPELLSQASFYEDTPDSLSTSLRMIKELNLDVYHYGQRDIFDTFSPDANENVPVTLRTFGAFMVNSSGKRFVNELAPRDEVAAAILNQPSQNGYLIFNEKLLDTVSLNSALLHSGYIYSAANIDDLAKRLDMEPATLRQTLKTYNEAVANKSDSEFGRDMNMNADRLISLEQGPYYAIKVHPVSYIRSTGVKVANISQPTIGGQIVDGLFIAGDFPGGVYGNQQLYGDDLTQSVVFGRHAAQAALRYVNGE